MLSLCSPSAVASAKFAARPAASALFSTHLSSLAAASLETPCVLHQQPPSLNGFSTLLNTESTRDHGVKPMIGIRSSILARLGGLSTRPASASFASSSIVRESTAVGATAADTWGEGKPEKHPGSPTIDMEESNDYMLMHPVYSKEYVESVAPKHKAPQKLHEYVAYYAIQACRFSFDKVTGYGADNMNKDKWLTRTIFLETVAGVPGMVAGMLRHMKSLRSMTRDHGWIHTLLEEAENERMHLMTFLQLKQPGPLFRNMVLLGQGVMFNTYMLLYILFPKTCHSAVGYLEEEAVKTYTHLVHDLDAGRIPEWKDKAAPEIAKKYWRLEESATMRDVFLAIRADEACHSYVNHTFSELKAEQTNPFSVGSHTVPK